VGHLPGEHWPISGPAGRYGAMCMLGTFSQYGVIHQYSAVRIEPDLPLDVAALVGCSVPTGWDTATNAADVRPGQTVVVYGIGGIGINAVQGARAAGARYVVAVDPIAFKRDKAVEFGATHPAAEAEEAHRIVLELTRGVGADTALVTVGRTPRLLDLYRGGGLKLDELITRRYSLEQVNEGYEDLLAGVNIRGLIVHEHG
jgi:Zn-dependent alcohol dehydrogenase